jgi:carbamoyltransferase
VGEEVARGKIVARFAGAMEWGARALGNRSILAHAGDPRNTERINSAIKMRDFWMPFAPSILAERGHLYLRNPKVAYSPFMMFAYESQPLAKDHLFAALHPRDFTLRAQTVTEKLNPTYHEVLKSFERSTGIGGFLNTSFNLHGYPIVQTPKDALDVFVCSGLKAIALENFYIQKKN